MSKLGWLLSSVTACRHYRQSKAQGTNPANRLFMLSYRRLQTPKHTELPSVSNGYRDIAQRLGMIQQTVWPKRQPSQAKPTLSSPYCPDRKLSSETTSTSSGERNGKSLEKADISVPLTTHYLPSTPDGFTGLYRGIEPTYSHSYEPDIAG